MLTAEALDIHLEDPLLARYTDRVPADDDTRVVVQVVMHYKSHCVLHFTALSPLHVETLNKHIQPEPDV